MAILETRDFLGMLDCHYHSHYPHSSSSSPPPSLHFSLQLTESDCSNKAERAFEEAEAEAEATTTITPAPINHSSTTSTSTSYSGNKRSEDQSVLFGENQNAILKAPLSSSSSSSSFFCVKWEGLMHPLILRGSITPLKIPLSRKASLTRFFQKRNERLQNLRLNERKFIVIDQQHRASNPGLARPLM